MPIPSTLSIDPSEFVFTNRITQGSFGFAIADNPPCGGAGVTHELVPPTPLVKVLVIVPSALETLVTVGKGGVVNTEGPEPSPGSCVIVTAPSSATVSPNPEVVLAGMMN